MRIQRNGGAIVLDAQAFRSHEFDGWRALSVLMALAMAGGCAALWSATHPRTPTGEPAGAGSSVSDAWTPAALPPLVEWPHLNAAMSAPRLGVAINAATGARRDAYALGDLGAGETAARLEAWTGADRGLDSLFVELAEQSSRFDAAILRFGIVKEMRSPRGNIEYAEMTLRDAGETRSCLGFRLAPTDAAGLRGIFCPAKPDRFVDGRLACLIEGAVLTPDGREGGLEAVLRAAPPRRTHGAC